MPDDSTQEFLRRAIQLAWKSMEENAGGPFGALVVKEGAIIAEGGNGVTATPDPTAHAEITAIRKAARSLNTFDLSGCILYASCEPCPMCLGAIYWAGIECIYFAARAADAAEAGFDDQFIYDEVKKPAHQRNLPTWGTLRDEGREVFKAWMKKEDKRMY